MGSATSGSYYALAPAAGWRLLMLDAYDVSLLGWPPGHPHHAQAAAILEERNPNAVRPAEAARSWEHARMPCIAYVHACCSDVVGAHAKV